MNRWNQNFRTRLNQFEPDRTRSNGITAAKKPKNRENDREKSYSKKKRYIKRIWITWATRKVCIYFLCLFVGQITGSLSGHVICLLEKLTLSINKFGFMLKLWDFLVFSSEHLISKKTSFTDNFAKSSRWSFSMEPTSRESHDLEV